MSTLVWTGVTHARQRATTRRRPIAAALNLAGAAARQLARWRERRRQRDALAQLDNRLLRDIGLTRAQAETEVAKPFWR